MKSRLVSLAVLQLEQYDTGRYLAVRQKVDPEVIKRIKWTTRLKLTKMLSYVLGVAGANRVIGAGVILAEQIIYWKTAQRIKRLKARGLEVVAIAGSYGKTSVKHYLYELLRHKYRVVATPESYNTVMGIAKCQTWEVDGLTQIFVVEVGAYQIGDITRLLKMVSPEIGILTGMARQHLERFGSWENIQIAKSEIAVYMNTVGGKLVANGSDEAVVQNVEKLGVKAQFYRGNERHETNLAGAKLVAKLLGMSEQEIKQVKVREPRSRFELTQDRYGMAVIDDSFSSNDRGFSEAVKYLGKQTKTTRILVTSGLVELGSESDQVHEQLGKKIIGNADLVILVGRNSRTASLAKGVAGKVKIIYIEKTLDFVQVVKELKSKKPLLVLLENDLTENY